LQRVKFLYLLVAEVRLESESVRIQSPCSLN
jgi:hypothetical protein